MNDTYRYGSNFERTHAAELDRAYAEKFRAEDAKLQRGAAKMRGVSVQELEREEQEAAQRNGWVKYFDVFKAVNSL